MSYCRSSSDDWQSDVYVWANVGGDWVTSVARYAIEWIAPIPDHVPEPDINDPAWFAWCHTEDDRVRDVMTMIHDRACTREVTRVPSEAGKMYHHGSPGECADNLERLRELGLWVPEIALKRLRKDQRDMDKQAEVRSE